MAEQRTLTPTEALRLLLDQVDYTKGACSVTEMVGAVLPKEVIERCHQTLEKNHG
jgi:hypothetical protein